MTGLRIGRSGSSVEDATRLAQIRSVESFRELAVQVLQDWPDQLFVIVYPADTHGGSQREQSRSGLPGRFERPLIIDAGVRAVAVLEQHIAINLTQVRRGPYFTVLGLERQTTRNARQGLAGFTRPRASVREERVIEGQAKFGSRGPEGLQAIPKL